MSKKKVKAKDIFNTNASQIMSVHLAQATAPKIHESIGQDWILFGEGGYENLYPQFLIDLYYNSSTHAAIVNATAEMIAGEDIILDIEEENLSPENLVELNQFLLNINNKETLHELIKKVAFDLKLHGSFALNIIWSQDGLGISEIYHVPVERLRVGKPNEMGVTDTYWVCPDWSDWRKPQNTPTPVPAFDKKSQAPSQILYTGTYSPGMDIYHTPDYVAATNWCLTDQQVSEFHLANISNGLAPSYFVSMNNGIPTAEERQQIEKQLTDKFAGASNAGKFILTFNEDKESSPEITPITVSNADKQYLALNDLVIQNIMIGHRVTSPMLLGVKTEGQLGGRDELLEAFDLYLNSVIKPYQHIILKAFTTLFQCNNVFIPISIQQTSPFSNKFGFETMKEVMTEDEIREELGLEPLAASEQTQDEELKSHKLSKLDKWIEEFGETITDDWECIDEEDAGIEDVDFNFEKELNKVFLTRHEFDMNDTSEQDGISKNYDYFRVRYEYSHDSGLTNKSGQSRDFCNSMMRSGQVFRKEDIIDLENESVNPGFGPGGDDTYSIWLYKGGVNCEHRWIRRIYKTTLEIGGYTDIDSAEIISTAKARSEGFYPESNEYEVPEAPKRMPNQGRLK